MTRQRRTDRDGQDHRIRLITAAITGLLAGSIRAGADWVWNLLSTGS